MKKSMKLLAVIISIVILAGCNNSKPGDGEVDTTLPLASDSEELSGEGNSTFPPDLTSEEGIKNYLVGEWIFDDLYTSDLSCRMKIDKDLNVQLSFHDEYLDEFKRDYKGEIKLAKIYAEADEAPDILSIDLNDSDYSGGDFFFFHRSTYDEKNLMSWFFAEGDNCVFEILGPEGFESVPGEITFQKEINESPQVQVRKNDEFYAVYWGKGKNGESLWLDDVQWMAKTEDDYDTDYPWQMTLYENDIPVSALYSILAGEITEILGDDLFPGEVYYVETDENGKVKHLISAERKTFLEESQDDYSHGDLGDDFAGATDYYFEEGSEDYMDSEFTDLMFSILLNDIVEIREYLDTGMSILFTGETIIIDDEECYFVFLGTNSEETFVREIHYAVNMITGQVYSYDILNDTWGLISQP